MILDYKLPRPERPRYFIKSLHKRAEYFQSSEVCIRSRIHPSSQTRRYSASEYKIKKNTDNFDLIGKVKVKVLFIAGFIILTILTTQMIFAASLATDGQKLSEIEQEIQRLEIENTDLVAQIAQVSSLKTLSQKAKQIGFEKPAKINTP